MSANQEMGLSFLFDTAYRFQPDFNRYVSNYVQFLKFENPHMDETQMSMAQQTLRVEFYRLCQESMGLASFDGLLIMDYSGILLDMNAMGARTLGIKREEVLGKPFFQQLFPETQIDHYLEWIQKNAKDEQDMFRKSIEVLMVKSNGTIFPADLKVTELKIFGSTLLVVCFNDITRRKWMDQALKYTEERYRKIMGENADAIFLIDPYNKRIEESNPAFNIMLSYSNDELFALRLYDVMEGDPEDLDEWVASHLQRGTRLLVREQGRFRNRQQHWVDVEYTCSVFELRDHPILCIIARDTAPREFVIKRTLADEQIENMQKQLTKMQTRLEEMGQTRLNKAQKEILDELNGYFDNLQVEVNQSIQKEQALIPTDILPQAFDLKAALYQVQSMFLEKLELSEIPVEISVEPDVPDIVIGKPLLLQEVLYHILSNAVKHTEEGDILIKVRLTDEEKLKLNVLFTIRDAGGGMDKVTKAKITDVINDESPINKGRQYGVRGLALSAYLIKAMGGRIWFNTLEGKGSSFLLSVPLEATSQEAKDLPDLSFELIQKHLALAETGAPETSQAEELKDSESAVAKSEKKPAESISEPEKLNDFVLGEEPKPSKPKKKTKKVKRNADSDKSLRLLLVENDVDHAITIQGLMRGRAIEMRMVDNGKKALELVQEQDFDMVFMAVDLPVMNGAKATQAIREWESKTQKEPLMIVGIQADKDTGEDLSQFNHSFVSPLNQDIFDDLINQCLHSDASDQNENSELEPEIKPEKEPHSIAEPEENTNQEQANESPAAGTVSSTDDKIQIELSADMAKLAPDFLKKRAGDITKIKQALSEKKYDSVRVIGKSMKGTGAVYGFSKIAEIGKQLEEQAGQESTPGIQKWLQELEHYISNLDIVVEA